MPCLQQNLTHLTVSILAVGGAITACAPAAFDYETATPEEQTVFLEDLALPMKKKLKRQLINPSGVGPRFKVTDHTLNPKSRSIEYVIQVSGMYQVSPQFREAQKDIMKTRCPGFTSSVFGRHNIVIRQKYITSKKAPLATIEISNSTCRKYI